MTDAGGASTTSEEITITVDNPAGNVAPTVQAAADPKTGTVPLVVRFSSAASDPDSDKPVGVGLQAVEDDSAAATHTYTVAGTYNAKVTPIRRMTTATVQVVVKPKTTVGRERRR